MPSIISVKQTGNFKRTDRFLHGLVEHHYMNKLRRYGRRGVEVLSAATPKDSGKTAESWSYEIEEEEGRTAIYWRNSHVVNGVNIAIILEYGHGTRTGGFVEGMDYIRPAIRPVFDEMAQEIWKEVVR